jgi:hypothetical protein
MNHLFLSSICHILLIPGLRVIHAPWIQLHLSISLVHHRGYCTSLPPHVPILSYSCLSLLLVPSSLCSAAGGVSKTNSDHDIQCLQSLLDSYSHSNLDSSMPSARLLSLPFHPHPEAPHIRLHLCSGVLSCSFLLRVHALFSLQAFVYALLSVWKPGAGSPSFPPSE